MFCNGTKVIIAMLPIQKARDFKRCKGANDSGIPNFGAIAV